MTAAEIVQVVTTVDSREAADTLAVMAVRGRVAACAQVDGPIASTYWWLGEVESAAEWRVTFKTTAEGYGRLAALVSTHHPYDVPELLCVPVLDGDPAYLAWVAAESVPR